MMTENRPLLKIKPINLGLHFGYFAVLTGLAAAGLISANITLNRWAGGREDGQAHQQQPHAATVRIFCSLSAA